MKYLAELKKKIEETGSSLANLCIVLDALGNDAATKYDCCANPDNNQARCETRGTLAMAFGITTPGISGVCLATDSGCNRG